MLKVSGSLMQVTIRMLAASLVQRGIERMVIIKVLSSLLGMILLLCPPLTLWEMRAAVLESLGELGVEEVVGVAVLAEQKRVAQQVD